MTAQTTHFKVDNGDMLLIKTSSDRRILVDINIRSDADDPDGDVADVAAQLRDRLMRDASGRLFVDAFLLTHPDHDHCKGLRNHFHLGPLSDWNKDDDKIVIREMWSSPIVFRRASKTHILCEDAKAWATEARRRVAKYRIDGYLTDGDRIRILGEDIDGKTDDLSPILVKVDDSFQAICGTIDESFQALLLAPISAGDEEEEDLLSKNNSSVILNISLGAWGLSNATKYLLGGDAEVAIWERLWDRNKDQARVFEYDVLIAPHHCSWHSLSWDSWSELGDGAEVSNDARSALSQVFDGATVISSSKPIEDDDIDPPCIRAKREYESILKSASGTFTCLGELEGDEPLEFEITSAGGPKPKDRKVATSLARPFIGGLAGAATGSSSALGAQPFKHG
jgi:hypothetical protein